MQVREYLNAVDDKRFDRTNFLVGVENKAKHLNDKFHFFRHLEDIRDVTFSSPLKGLPISVKDNICVKDMPSSAGSKILDGYIPPFDATAVSRIRRSGGHILGKTNMDEFGFGTFSTNSAYGIPLNPHDPERTCGGSSGGAAGLVAAADFPHIALAESTGGSISCPAAFCGVVGITPTYGLVSRHGLIDYSNSLDKIGTIGKNVHDAALLLSCIAGRDEMDFTSAHVNKFDYAKHAMHTEARRKIAIPKEYMKNLDKDVEKTFWDGVAKLEEAGTKCKQVSMPTAKLSLSAYYIIATCEASTNLARYCGMRYGLHHDLHGNFDEYFSAVRTEGFGQEAKRRIMLGTFARMSGYRDQYYAKALQVRTMIINDFKKILKGHDAIAAPTMPVVAPRFADIKKMSPLDAYQMDILTVGPNLAGLPMISVPCKTNKLPIGMHLIGDHLEESTIIEIAAAFEHVNAKGEKK